MIAEIGHIGYGVRPSTRRRGVGTWALGRILEVAGQSGMNRVLLICEASNTASINTIERNGGDLEAVVNTADGPVARYWINVIA